MLAVCQKTVDRPIVLSLNLKTLFTGSHYVPNFKVRIFKSFLTISFRANKINPSWIALKKSRGLESHEHKLFMRYTGRFFFSNPVCSLTVHSPLFFCKIIGIAPNFMAAALASNVLSLALGWVSNLLEGRGIVQSKARKIFLFYFSHLPSPTTINPAAYQSKRKSSYPLVHQTSTILLFGCPKPKSSWPKSLARNSKLKSNRAFHFFNPIITLVNCFCLKPKMELVKKNEVTLEWQS